MYKVAMLELVVCWVLWSIPFARRAFFGEKRKPAVTVRAAKWGMVLQAISYMILVRWRMPPDRVGMGRLAVSMLCGPLAVALAWTAVPRLGKQWRMNAGLYPDHELVQTGAYGVVRHPIYASMLAIFLGLGLLLARWQALAIGLVLFVAGVEIRVRIEDRLLESRFGEEFRAYRRRVRAYLPSVR